MYENVCEDVDKKLAVASQQYSVSYFLVQHRVFHQTNITAIPHPPYSPDLALCYFSLFFPTEDQIKRQLVWHG